MLLELISYNEGLKLAWGIWSGFRYVYGLKEMLQQEKSNLFIFILIFDF